MARTSTKKDNRERARQRRAELDAERARRDAAIEDAASAFYDAEDARAVLLEQLEALDTDRASAVGALVELKETNARIAQLLDIPPLEVRRLRELAAGETPVPASQGADDGSADQSAEDVFVEHGESDGQAA